MEIFSLAILGLLIVISPGADFILVLKNSINLGRKAGFFTAFGISLAIGVHISYSMLGISYIISQNIMLFTAIKYIGATYLIYLGVKSIVTAHNKIGEITLSDNVAKPMQNLIQGFFCNALNPKTMLFFISLFSQLITPESNSNNVALLYGLYIAVLHGLWFSLVTILFTSKAIQNKLMRHEKKNQSGMWYWAYFFGVILAAKS